MADMMIEVRESNFLDWLEANWPPDDSVLGDAAARFAEAGDFPMRPASWDEVAQWLVDNETSDTETALVRHAWGQYAAEQAEQEEDDQ